jgi:dipeptidase E
VKHKPTLVLYSGGQSPSNRLLHGELVRLARQKTDEPLRFTYLPFCSDGSQTYFMRSVRRYARYGVGEFCCLAADERPSRAQIREALRAHIVYLAGGNTFYFLRALRRSGLLSFLREYSERGGILAGLSAGAHILTPHIALAGARGLDPDPNEVGLRDLKALGLAPFEILPHLRGGRACLAALRAYSRGSRYPIYACPDGSGVVVQDGATRLIGRGIRLFSAGIELRR